MDPNNLLVSVTRGECSLWRQTRSATLNKNNFPNQNRRAHPQLLSRDSPWSWRSWNTRRSTQNIWNSSEEYSLQQTRRYRWTNQIFTKSSKRNPPQCSEGLASTCNSMQLCQESRTNLSSLSATVRWKILVDGEPTRVWCLQQERIAWQLATWGR